MSTQTEIKRTPSGWYLDHGLRIRPKSIAYHRNGIGGAPFHVIVFDWQDDKTTESGKDFMAVVFEEKWHAAMFDIVKLSDGDIEFGSNSWRGDNYEPQLRAAIRDYRDRAHRDDTAY
jgi:hypothetical protein